jgi:ATP-dependent helicase/nuclease subunit A
VVLPPWLHTNAHPEKEAEAMLRPSDPADDEGRGLRTGESEELRARALQRGTLVHRLLQSLPDLESARRREAADHFLAHAHDAKGWSETDRNALAAQVLALLDDTRFAAVFAPGSRAEVSIVGRLDRTRGGTLLVNGQIDRLVVTPDAVLIVDYKTNHTPPRRAADAPKTYIRQLALYRAVLAKLYPDRPIRAALLWTELTEMIELSASALDAGLASVISS